MSCLNPIEILLIFDYLEERERGRGILDFVTKLVNINKIDISRMSCITGAQF